MEFPLVSNQKVKVIGSAVNAAGDASQAVLSGVSYSSSDTSVFTVETDPDVSNGAIIRGVSAGAATLTEVATATEPDGVTTESITGTATITITAAPAAPAASIVFTFGTPEAA